MGVDASYVMWYRKGLLKLIQQEVSDGHYYLGDDGYRLVRRAYDGYDADEEGQPSIDFEICETNSRGVSCTSSVYFYYASGVVRVCDGRRYFGEHNEEYNGNAVGFYSELLRNLSRNEEYSYTYCDAYCDVIMEGYYDPADQSDKPQPPIILWCGLGAGYAGLLFWTSRK